MDRRSFIKTIAAATTAPLALLKAKPAAKFIELEAGEVYKSKVYPMLGDTKTDDAGRVFRYVKFEATPSGESAEVYYKRVMAMARQRPGRLQKATLHYI